MAETRNSHHPTHRHRITRVYVLALLLSLSLFVLHVVVILDAAGALVDHEEWMLAHLRNYPGEVVLLGCFFVLFAAHLGAASVACIVQAGLRRSGLSFFWPPVTLGVRLA